MRESLDRIVDNANRSMSVAEGDYYDSESLLCCGKCKTRKQMHLSWIDGKDIVVPIMCKCMEEAVAKEEAEKSFRERQQAIDELKASSMMDSRFASCTFATTKVTEDNKTALAICKRYVERFDKILEKNQGLLLWGNPSTGKTHAACCIANELMNRMYPVIATSFVTLVNDARDINSNAIDKFNAKARSADLMIIDDLGAERDTDFATEIVYNIIDSRYKSMKPIIITTNLSLDEIAKPSDIRHKRIYERILESCYPIHFYGDSWRKKEAKTRFDEMRMLLEE